MDLILSGPVFTYLLCSNGDNISPTRYRELIIFPLELNSTYTHVLVNGSFEGIDGLLNFVLNQRPGLAQHKKQGKTPLLPAVSGTF